MESTADEAESQSPSLRGSGRFQSPRSPHGGARPSLNPLHCGAVVASFRRIRGVRHARHGLNPLHCGAVVASGRSRKRGRAARQVSIPFIAGQWSLLPPPSREGGGRPRLNPLHCGAVVASPSGAARENRDAPVSIPFIAGQWSLPPTGPPGGGCGDRSQSPSLRGSGRFEEVSGQLREKLQSLNPLHCGAVVASC